MNVAGIITNMPAIVGAKHVPLMGKVKGYGVPDTMKIMATGMKRMYSAHPGAAADRAYAAKMGDWSQDVAQLHNQTAMMNSKSGFMRAVTGDPAYRDYANYTGAERARRWMRFKGVEGMASVATDSSENWSRQVSHFIGLQLADLHGIQGMAARHTFARQIANDAIANYDALNRPEIYQSAFGSMYGLFLSYAQNWMQRMFRYVEDGQWNALGRQAALQASLFGFTGLPGIRAIADLVGGEEEGDGLIDGIYQRFGAGTGAVVAFGGLNQLTTLLGLPAMAIHARGDMNFRHPSFDVLTGGKVVAPVGIEVLSDIVNGGFEILGRMIDPNIPMTGRFASEILARQMPNRFMKGALTVLANQGQEADAYGNVMAETQGWAESGMRMLGLRSLRQASEIEAYFLNQKARDINAQRMDGLRQASRAMIRSGDLSKLPETFESYLNANGSPHEYANWIRGLIQEANNTRTENQLLETLRSPKSQVLAQRILNFTE